MHSGRCIWALLAVAMTLAGCELKPLAITPSMSKGSERKSMTQDESKTSDRSQTTEKSAATPTVIPVSIAVIGLATEEKLADGATPKSRYLQALKRFGASYVLVGPGARRAEIESAIDRTDGVLLIGGADVDPKRYNAPIHAETKLVEPARDATDFLAFELALQRGRPILGICRGCQVINVARGGTLIQHLPDTTTLPHRGEKSDATHAVVSSTLCRSLSTTQPAECTSQPTYRTLRWPERFEVNSAHHQAIGELGEGLVVLARAEDGTIEAIGAPAEFFVLGVQWHPERIVDRPLEQQLFTTFLMRCMVDSRR